MKRLKTCAAFFLAMFAGAAQAALFDRGGGLIYDDVLNVTWLQDANYARSSGLNSDGVLLGYQAVSWANNLTYFDSVRNVTYNDWRLPSVRPIGANWNYQFSTDGTTDWGPNNTSQKNELSYMYFVNLGLKSFFNVDGSANPNFGVFDDGTISGQRNVNASGVTIFNLNAGAYWAGTRWELPQNGVYYYNFNTAFGETNAGDEYMSAYAWAVRDGDVSPVPLPPSFALMLSGLALLGLSIRFRRGISTFNNS